MFSVSGELSSKRNSGSIDPQVSVKCTPKDSKELNHLANSSVGTNSIENDGRWRLVKNDGALGLNILKVKALVDSRLREDGSQLVHCGQSSGIDGHVLSLAPVVVVTELVAFDILDRNDGSALGKNCVLKQGNPLRSEENLYEGVAEASLGVGLDDLLTASNLRVDAVFDVLGDASNSHHTLVCVGGVDTDVGGADIDIDSALLLSLLASLSSPLFCTHDLCAHGLDLLGLVTLGIDDG
jgi:hypothetical protein